MSPEGPSVEVLEREALVPSEIEARHRPARLSVKRKWTVLLVLALVAALVQAGVGRRAVVNPGGWVLVRRFFAAALDPELSGSFLRLTWEATATTLSYAVVGAASSVVIGLIGGVLASQTWWGAGTGGRWRWLVARGGLALPRGVHEAVWALALVNVLGSNPLVAVLAIAIPYGAVTAKVFSELLDDTPHGAYEALRAAGAGRLKAFCYSLLPQCLPDFVSYSFYRFECAIRAATILGLIGAGGLGFQLLLSFQTLRYREMWTLLFALVVVSGLADAWSALVRRRLRPRPFPTSSTDPDDPPGRPRFLLGSVVAGLVLFVACVWHLGIDITTLWSERTQRLLGDIASASFPPRAGLFRLFRLSVETLAMSVLATTLACLGGMLTALLSAPGRTLGRRAAGHVTRALLLVCRAIPPPVWALVFLFVLFPGPLPGAVALAVYNFGVLGRLMAEVVENHDRRPGSALTAQGVGHAPAFLYGVAPLVLPRFVAYGIYRWEVTIRETVVVGLVGAGGLGRLLSEQLAAFDYRGALATALALVILTLLVDLVSASVRRSLR